MSVSGAIAIYEEITEELLYLISYQGVRGEEHSLNDFRTQLTTDPRILGNLTDLKEISQTRGDMLKGVPSIPAAGMKHQHRVQAAACFSVVLKRIDAKAGQAAADLIVQEVKSLPTYGMF